IDAVYNALVELSNENKNSIYIAFYKNSEKIQYVVITNKNSGFDSLGIINKINELTDGKGSGKSTFARGGSSKVDKLNNTLNWLEESDFNCA
ncbi:MAG: hypothetical protein K2N40_02140, partial [Ureaplasma sp.]|nr:hypothetical protein [Ureaplasma sp.]